MVLDEALFCYYYVIILSKRVCLCVAVDSFSWEEYLKETSAIPAPPSCFRQVSSYVSDRCALAVAYNFNLCFLYSI